MEGSPGGAAPRGRTAGYHPPPPCRPSQRCSRRNPRGQPLAETPSGRRTPSFSHSSHSSHTPFSHTALRRPSPHCNWTHLRRPPRSVAALTCWGGLQRPRRGCCSLHCHWGPSSPPRLTTARLPPAVLLASRRAQSAPRGPRRPRPKTRPARGEADTGCQPLRPLGPQRMPPPLRGSARCCVGCRACQNRMAAAGPHTPASIAASAARAARPPLCVAQGATGAHSAAAAPLPLFTRPRRRRTPCAREARSRPQAPTAAWSRGGTPAQA